MTVTAVIPCDAEMASAAFAYCDLERSPKGFVCDTLIGEDTWCPAKAVVDYRDRHDYEDHTYKCGEHAPARPGAFRAYDVFFDWRPLGRDIGERRVVTWVIARGPNEALLLYRAFVDGSRFVNSLDEAYGSPNDANEHVELSDDWNANVIELPEPATKREFLVYVRDAISRDKTLAPWFEDVLT